MALVVPSACRMTPALPWAKISYFLFPYPWPDCSSLETCSTYRGNGWIVLQFTMSTMCTACHHYCCIWRNSLPWIELLAQNNTGSLSYCTVKQYHLWLRSISATSCLVGLWYLLRQVTEVELSIELSITPVQQCINVIPNNTLGSQKHPNPHTCFILSGTIGRMTLYSGKSRLTSLKNK